MIRSSCLKIEAIKWSDVMVVAESTEAKWMSPASAHIQHPLRPKVRNSCCVCLVFIQSHLSLHLWRITRQGTGVNGQRRPHFPIWAMTTTCMRLIIFQLLEPASNWEEVLEKYGVDLPIFRNLDFVYHLEIGIVSLEILDFITVLVEYTFHLFTQTFHLAFE
jgi:hypothetical protein